MTITSNPNQNTQHLTSQLKQLLREWLGLQDAGDMPKIDPPAGHIQEFMLDDGFQKTFDDWKARVEEEQHGTIEITFQETIRNGTRMLVTWGIKPKRTVARRR